MAVTIVYLTTPASRWRLALPAYNDDKADNLKAKLVLGLKGIGPEQTREILCECKWIVLRYGVPIVRNCEDHREIDFSSNCENVQ